MMKYFFYMIFLIPLSLDIRFWIFQVYLISLMFFMLMQMDVNLSMSSISYNLGMDLLSYMMIMLSIFICLLMVLASEKLFKDNFYYGLFNFFILILLFSLFLAFCSLNLFVFYLFFEISLLPVLLLILGWGNQPERMQAGFYLLFYTLFASLPMMISIFFYYKINLTLDFFYFQVYDIGSSFIYLCMMIVFLIKMPMYSVHLWLPKAHVEAPVSGSMILAGIMLKLGGYGLMRMTKSFVKIGLSVNLIFIILGLIGGAYISIICITQSDLKSLIAYSSVAHMSLVMSGLLTLNFWGVCGSLVLMIAHGLCSSGLFGLANLNYERLTSRSIYINKGLLSILPSLSLFWFLFCSFNMAAPPSMNLLGEIMLLCSIIMYSLYMMYSLMFVSFFSAVYSLFMFSFTQHGNLMKNIMSLDMITMREYLMLIMHLFPLVFFIVKSELVSTWL